LIRKLIGDAEGQPAGKRAPAGLGQSFPAVLLAARSGAEWAWTALYRHLSPSVLGYLRSRGAAEPEDLMGEVFLQIARDLPTFTGGEAEFRSWVFVMAHHRLLDERRSRSRRPSDPAPDETILARAPTGNVEEEALATLATQRVLRLLAGVSEQQAEVLMLRIVGGLTVEEVARAVGKKPNSVKALQRRGLAAIKEKLASEVSTL
jgi:RNA polymerase sigma factor (sigma-70 family)